MSRGSLVVELREAVVLVDGFPLLSGVTLELESGSLTVVTGANGAQHADACAALAASHGLRGSVGSDFHNPKAAWNPLGRSLQLPDDITPVWRSFGISP